MVFHVINTHFVHFLAQLTANIIALFCPFSSCIMAAYRPALTVRCEKSPEFSCSHPCESAEPELLWLNVYFLTSHPSLVFRHRVIVNRRSVRRSRMRSLSIECGSRASINTWRWLSRWPSQGGKIRFRSTVMVVYEPPRNMCNTARILLVPLPFSSQAQALILQP